LDVSQAPAALILDFLVWLEAEPRLYDDASEAWHTSCPRLTIWEDTFDRGLVERQRPSLDGALLTITEAGRALLDTHRPQRVRGAAQR
jgi:hypothetical protein